MSIHIEGSIAECPADDEMSDMESDDSDEEPTSTSFSDREAYSSDSQTDSDGDFL
jgi:hypothetical protein